MTHFAEISADGTVLRVLSVHDNDAATEAAGIAFCKGLYGANTNWVQTSYNGNIRRRFAGIGYKYDAARNAFIPPQPFPSWTLSPAGDWQPPRTMPQDGKQYSWDEATLNWKLP